MRGSAIVKSRMKESSPRLSLHGLLGALSYWGSAVRVMLFGFVYACAQYLGYASSVVSLEQALQQWIYIVAVFVVFDLGYVTIARALPIGKELVDRGLFLVMALVYASVFLLPWFIHVSADWSVSTAWVLLAPLLVLSGRIMMGFLFGHRAGR